MCPNLVVAALHCNVSFQLKVISYLPEFNHLNFSSDAAEEHLLANTVIK